ncbi:MAG: serine protease, partial [Desulfobacterales bacterium]|nr:serine protease [Desulfobacterales bacterium]
RGALKNTWKPPFFFHVSICLILTLYGATAPAGAGDDPTRKTGAARIVGGVEAQPDAWPWMAALLPGGASNPYWSFYCGASLISPKWALTAAHCVSEANGSFNPDQNVDVLIGVHDLTKKQGERIHVSRIIRNPDYDHFLTDGDLALLELETPSTKTPVRIMGQSLADPLVVSGPATTIGWGATRTDGSGGTETLLQVTVPIVTNAECQRAENANGYGATITDNMVCAGPIEGGEDACFGDSGGPLVISDDQGWIQVGIVSFGPPDGCALPGAYGIYTRLSRYAGWITENICDPSELPPGPVIAVETAGRVATLSFDPVQGASGYQLYYAPHPGAS